MAMTVSLSVDVRKYCDHVNGCIESVKGQNLKEIDQADVFLMLFSPMLYSFVI